MNIKFTNEELKILWGKLLYAEQPKVKIINNSLRLKYFPDETNTDLNMFDQVNDIIKKQVPLEFFKYCSIDDVTIVLLDKGFSIPQINQILKAKEDGKNLDKLLDKKIAVEDLRTIRTDDEKEK